MLRVLILGLLCSACEPVFHYFGLGDDSLPEEVIEATIEYELNIPIDLTPSSPE